LVAVPELPPDRPPLLEARLDELAEHYLAHSLDYLERNALLEPGA